MSNTGLKAYTKQLIESLDYNGSTAYINLNENDANTIIEISLFKTVGERPLDISILYNYKDSSNQGYFGVGSNISFFKSISISGSIITITNSDGSKDNYVCYGVMNEETNMKMEERQEGLTHYDLVDKYNNRYVFNSTNKSYPKKIEKYGNTYYTIYESSSRFSCIQNDYGDEVSFSYGYNGYVSVIIYKHYGTIKYKSYISYSSNHIISRIQTKRVNGQEEILISDTSLTIASGTIILKNELNNSYLEYILTGNKVTKYFRHEDSNSFETNIEYLGNRTRVIDYLGLEYNVIFSNNFPIYELNDLGQLLYKEYDNNTKKVLQELSLIDIYHQDESLITSNLFNYLNSGLSLENYTETNSFYSSFLGDVYKVFGTGYLEKTIYVNGLASDNLSLVLFGKMLTVTTDTSYVEIRLNSNGSSRFKKIDLDSNYEMISIGEVAQNSYSSIKISIVLYGNASVAIGGLCLCKKDFGSLYTYDSVGNIQDKSTGYGSEQIEYYNNSFLKNYVDVDSSCYAFKYDNYGNMLECKSAYGVKINRTYNNCHPITNEIKNGTGNKGLLTTSTYSSGLLSTFTNELGHTTSFNYDSYGRLKKVINALNEIEEYTYDDLDNIINYKISKLNASIEMTYTYDSMNRITSASLANGSDYTFLYDLNGNLSTIVLNNTIIYSIEYNNDNFPTKIKTGNSVLGYSFTYTEEYMLDSIYYVNENNISELKYQYIYNDKKQLFKILNGNNAPIKQYTYDIDGKIVKIIDSVGSIQYQYDHLGEVSNIKRDFVDFKIYQSYDSISRSKGSNPEAIIPSICGSNVFVCGIFNNDSCVLLGDNIGYDVADNVGISYGKDKIIPYVIAENGLKYYTYPSLNQPSGSVAYWFKPSVSLNGKVMFSVKRPSTMGVGLIKVEVVNNCLSLSVLDVSNQTYQVLTTSNSIVLNEWNFFSVIFFKRYDDYSTYDSEFALTLNGKTIVRRYQNPWINYEIGAIPEYHIGSNFDDTLSISCPITCLSIGYMNNMSLNALERYFRCTKDYIIENLMDENYDIVDFSNTTLHTFNQSLLSSFEIYPLQNSVTSLNGLKPSAFNLRKTSIYDKDRTFNYNKLIKHYAYVADGEELAYNINISQTGTIMMRAYIDCDSEKQFFFEAKDINNHRIGLYRGENNVLYIKIDNSCISTNLTFSSYIWHTVGLSFDENISGDSIISVTKYLRVYLDGNSYEITNTINHSYGLLTLMIGRTFDDESTLYNIGKLSNYNALLGQIEMLSIRGAYCTVSVLNQLSSALISINKTSMFDDLGMIRRSVIYGSGNEILSNTYTYKINPNISTSDVTYITNIPEAENIMYSNYSTTIGYVVDNLNRVTLISSSSFNNGHSYSYDYRGFLISEDNISYTYDENGNILSAGSDSFEYDEVIKDRLKSVNNVLINYSSIHPLLPVSFGNSTYRFEGKRLINYRDLVVDLEYTYDENGLIIKKVERNTSLTTTYSYDDKRLITEINGNIRNDYLYDEYNKLYGFIQNGTDLYFYVRDYLGNILGLVDNSGNIVVKYNYDSYGNNMSYVGTNVYNPFIYKGYYYDYDIKMYYCHTRFYNPNWRRWLTPDNPYYMDQESISGMNLFAYCNNNPVMYSDGEGRSPEWWQWLLSGAAVIAGIALSATGVGGILGGVLIGAGASSMINGYVNEANGGSFTAGYWGGAISGALCGVGAGLGGLAFAAASEATNLACFGYLAAGCISSFAGGFLGNFAGTVYTEWHNSDFKKFTVNSDIILNSFIIGSLNVFAGLGAAASTITSGMGRIAADVNSKVALRIVSGLIAGGIEATYDSISYLISVILNNL